MTKTALLILRVSLGIFMLIWAVDKFQASAQTVKIFSHFYKIGISQTHAKIIGAGQALLCLAFLGGLWKRWTYGAMVILHGISTFSTYEKLLSPFGKNHLFVATIPVLGAFIALYLMRDEDTLFTLRG